MEKDTRDEGLELEGEGSYKAAHEYHQKATEFARSGKVAGAAKEAEAAIDTAEEQALDAAVEEGKRHAAEEDTLLYSASAGPEDPHPDCAVYGGPGTDV